MERKDVNNENKNFSSGIAAEEITTKEKDENLEKIVNDIF